MGLVCMSDEEVVGHSHTGLFLLHAVVSQCAEGSGRQDVQKEVHLQTQL